MEVFLAQLRVAHDGVAGEGKGWLWADGMLGWL